LSEFEWGKGEILAMALRAQAFFTIVCFVTALNAQINDDFVLPNSTRPEEYFLIMTTNVPAASRRFTGFLGLTLRVEEATNEIFLHSRQRKFSRFTLYELQGGNAIKVDNIQLIRESDDFIKITSPNELKVGSAYELQLEFEGNLLLTSDGFFSSSFVTKVNGSDVYT
jgi:Peptidase M1 N-terminal domain